MHISYPKEVKELAKTLEKAGYECYLVGGAVRDQLLGKDAKDFDVTTNAKPQEVLELFPRVIPTGIDHGTVTVMKGNLPIEVTTYRIDGKYTDGRRPDEISYTLSIEEDLKRRDFTINSIAYDMHKNRIYDPNAGLDDLSRGIIRAIGNPLERFDEDGLRSIRACRFAAQLHFKIDNATLQGIKESLHRIPGLSKERIYDELMKIMKTQRPSVSFELFEETGILALILPELQEGVGLEQRGMHRYDVFHHSIYSCDGIPASEPILRLAALFHDLGKVSTAKEVDGTMTFHCHERDSSKIAKSIMSRYRFPNRDIKKIIHLIDQHMFHYEPQWTDSAVRRFISRVGVENLQDLFILRQGDIWGTARQGRSNQSLEDLQDRIHIVLEEENAFTIKDLAVNGKILSNKAGIPPSRQMGQVLDFLLESVLDDPSQNNQDKLIELAKNYYRQVLLA